MGSSSVGVKGGTVKPLIIDVTDSKSIEDAAAQVQLDGVPLVALVNNAGA